MAADELHPGLHEALVTRRLEALLAALPGSLVPEIGGLANAEAADRISRHIAGLTFRVIAEAPEGGQAVRAAEVATHLITTLAQLAIDPTFELTAGLVEPARVLSAILRLLPDGRPEKMDRPLTPLLDTTVFTNAPGEPAVGHELNAEIPSADEIDAVVAFIRWSGVRPLLPSLQKHCDAGKPLRVLTTTYTNSTELRALEELKNIGAEVRVSYDTSSNRLHAKAWLFSRESGYSTAYIGSSNLSYSAQVPGLEWNVRLSEARNPDAVAKMAAVFESYWNSREFKPFGRAEFIERTATTQTSATLLAPFEFVLRPFQEALLDDLALARHQGHHRNLLVAATGTGKTVMAAVDYARLQPQLPRSRLLFIAHREEILEQSLQTFRHVLRDGSFGEKWVGTSRPTVFNHVFASIQSLHASDVTKLDPTHFDVVVVDEFHHAAAPSYEAVLGHLSPRELLGLTATPERADGLDVLRYFDGRIAAELRLWDAIDQQYLVPFSYYGIHDGLDLTDVPWRRGRGYDLETLTGLFTADHAWAHRVIAEVERKIGDPGRMRALAFCVGIDHAAFMADRFNEAGIPAVAISGRSRPEERAAALRDLGRGDLCAVFAVDLFNEGVDVPAVDTLLLLRPTDSGTLFLQQLGRGLRKSPSKVVCTVLDFVGTHRKEFRFDRRLRALLGGSRRDIERQVYEGFPFLPAGCTFELDAVAREVVLRSLREAIPSAWRDRVRELSALGDVDLREFLDATGLELEDVYQGRRSWTQLRREAGLPTLDPGPNEADLLRAVGRMLHVDDDERIDGYAAFAQMTDPPNASSLPAREHRLLRMMVASLTTLPTDAPFADAVNQVWGHPAALQELHEVLGILRGRESFVEHPLGLHEPVPLAVHARYTRTEILAAFGTGHGARPRTWQTGVWWDEPSRSDLFAFTLDKTVGAFSPTTRYRDYAISPFELHWESQSATSVDSATGQRYIHHLERGTNVLLFGRLRADERAFWCLGPASYISHSGNRPISFVWRLHRPLPAGLYTRFAAAVA